MEPEVNGTADSALVATLSSELHSTTHCTENCHLDTAPNGFSGFGLFTCCRAL